MALKKVGIQLYADTINAQRNIDKVDSKLDKAARSAKDFGKASIDAFKKTAVTAGATAAAVTTFAVATAKAERETQNLARLTRQTAEEFKALNFAVRQYGLQGENIADIAKDIADKIGEYVTDSAGPFGDFINVIGATTEEGKKLAEQMQHLSGPDAIQLMVSRMEKAGATTAQMSWALESMGNDLTLLLPLFRENGEELERLEKRYESATKQLELTIAQKQDIQELSESWDLLTTSMGAGASNISATLAPALKDLIDYVTSNVPTATQNLASFINVLLPTDAVSNLDEINARIEDRELHLKTLMERREKLRNQSTGAFDVLLDSLGVKDIDGELRITNERIDASNQELEKLLGKRLEIQKETLAQYDHTGHLDAFLNKPKTEEEQKPAFGPFDTPGEDATSHLDAWLENEQIYRERYEQDYEDFYLRMNKRSEEFYAAQELVATNSIKSSTGAILTALEQGGKEQTALYKALFLANKAIAIPQMIVDTEKAATAALAVGGPAYSGLVKGLGYASIGAVIGTSLAEVSGGRNSGGPAQANNSYLFGEVGPEVYTDKATGRQILTPGPEGGAVTPLKTAPASKTSMNVTVNNNAPGVEVRTSKVSDTEMEIIVQAAAQRAKDEFSSSVTSGYGEYSDALNGSFSMDRRFG